MKANAGVITGVRVTHEDATVEEIEAACADRPEVLLGDLLAREGVSEAFILQTCNRAEAYVVTPDPSLGRAALVDAVADADLAAWTGHEESLRHLMRVAAGLESLVVGEDQILGQVKDAYETARGAGAIGFVLEDALLKAIHVGERARAETTINEGRVSLGSAAVALAAEECNLGSASALVVGAGEMGRLAAEAFAREGVERLSVANRTVGRAERVASEIDAEAEAVGLDELDDAAADVIVTATDSPEPVVTRDALADRECVVVDIARPRDVEPAAASLDGVTVHDLDALEAVTDRTRERRRAAAREVEALIDRELDHLLERFKRKRADEVIGAMYEGAERAKRQELSTALTKLESQGGLTDEQRETVESLADALVNQLLAAPTKSLRDAAGEDDWTTINTALQLFDPEFGGDDVEPVSADAPRDLPDEAPDGMPPEVAAELYGDD